MKKSDEGKKWKEKCWTLFCLRDKHERKEKRSGFPSSKAQRKKRGYALCFSFLQLLLPHLIRCNFFSPFCQHKKVNFIPSLFVTFKKQEQVSDIFFPFPLRPSFHPFLLPQSPFSQPTKVSKFYSEKASFLPKLHWAAQNLPLEKEKKVMWNRGTSNPILVWSKQRTPMQW